ncbi:hypothetical protein PHMEG_00031953 [Phytophthora megakarya]|uniref:Crinkler effector protein N-terminal domain-containing protein n=1 Tax=Phytophthora megakarya TaxID=4795 RepID=A0A225UZB9_9STRA|nr:hypothetical protein PHMEG_00031953 [Phytophthora megakarya]
MVKFFCAIVGVAGSSYPVNIDENETVGDLKKAIRDDNSATITCDARELQLFLAKKGDAWMNKEYVASVTLDKERHAKIEDENGRPQPLEHMNETADVVDYFGERFKRKRGEIHVLVVVPEPAQPQTGLWLVSGSIEDALNTKGILSRVYCLAMSRLGYYDPAHRTQNKNAAFWYEDKKLCIHILFKPAESVKIL